MWNGVMDNFLNAKSLILTGHFNIFIVLGFLLN